MNTAYTALSAQWGWEVSRTSQRNNVSSEADSNLKDSSNK